jgi:drug/metabolite transporter (DMT)-like permease
MQWGLGSWGSGGLVLAIVVLNQMANIGASTCFALSGRSHDVHTFVVWQIVGGLFGLCIQLTFAGMARYATLPFANSVGIGLAFVSVQVVSALLFFHTSFSVLQWAGTALVVAGVLCVALG